MNVTFQGNVAINGTTKIFCSSESLSINNIVINNLTNVAYNVTVNIISVANNIKTTLYTFDLDAGDTLRDNTLYVLNTEDYIQIISDVPGTTFYIGATQI